MPFVGTHLLQALRTNDMAEINARVFAQVSLDLIPVSLIATDAVAPSADGEQPLQRFDMLERIRQTRRNPLNSSSAMTCLDRACIALTCPMESWRASWSMTQSVPSANPSGLIN